MGNVNVSHVHDSKKASSLLDLPDEMILHICSFLDMSTLHDLNLVCKRFNEILKKNTFMWKARINRLWPYISYPLLRPANPDKLFWKRSCLAIEKQTALWKEWYSMEELKIANLRYGMIDTLLLMHAGTTCIASTSTCQLLYCKLPSPKKLSCKTDQSEIKDCMPFAHQIDRRIWDMTAIDNMIYSCSWDQSIKLWMLINTGLIQLSTYSISESEGALRCISSCPERSLYAIGSEKKTIFVFDSRSGHKPIRQYRPHTEAVIKLAMNSEYILSASEDKTVSVWDLRAGRTIKSIAISGGGLPTCVNMQRDWVCVGDSTAKVHLLDLKNDSELVKSYSTKHKKKITGVHMTDGCLITAGSVDCTVRISSLTDPPQPITYGVCTGFRESISRMDYLNDTLAISGIDCSLFGIDSHIALWRPKMATHSTKGTKNSLAKTSFLDLPSTSADESREYYRRRRKYYRRRRK